nr:MAG TPA_asm: hypothetical protein [Caudoviricetes sp.]DAM14629.1 MAG TPA: hypothetical protein [Caudoviricetes sp.]
MKLLQVQMNVGLKKCRDLVLLILLLLKFLMKEVNNLDIH